MAIDPINFARTTQVRLRRGTTEEIAAKPPVEAEPFYDLTSQRIGIGGGSDGIVEQWKSQFLEHTADATDAVPRNLQEKLTEIVSVKDFGAVGDGVTDDTEAIQRAIDFVTNTSFEKTWPDGSPSYSKGGGWVRFPEGKYRITDTLLVGQHCRLQGSSTTGLSYDVSGDVTGSVIIADFSNENKWAISSANYDSSGNQVGYKSNITGSDINQGTFNATNGIEIHDLIVFANNYSYGGVRLCGSSNFKVSNVSVIGFGIGFFVCASWGVSFSDVMTSSYLYGIFASSDVNGIRISGGYFNGLSGKEIDDSNRPEIINKNDFNSTVGVPTIYNKRTGFFLYYCNTVFLDSPILTDWDFGAIFCQVKGLSSNSMYVQDCSDAYFSCVSTSGSFSGLHQYNPAITNGYVFGHNVKVTMTGVPSSGIVGTQDTDSYININTGIPDTEGWKFYEKVNYVGAKQGVIRVSSSGDVSNLAINASYTTLDEAMSRIVNSSIYNWVVWIADGDSVTLSSNKELSNKSITFMREGWLSEPSIIFESSTGDPKRFFVTGNVDLYFHDVSLKYSPSTSAASSSIAGFILLTFSSIVRLNFISCTIELQDSWAILQQGFLASSQVISSFQSCTINGSGSARIMSAAPGNSGYANVINVQHSTTTSSSIKSMGTNGWVNANVISSNF